MIFWKSCVMLKFSRAQKCQIFGPVPAPSVMLENVLSAALTSSRFGSALKSSSCRLHCSKQTRFREGSFATTTCSRFEQWKHSIASSEVKPVKSSVSPTGLYEDAQ